jgi:hypothetical protein
MRFSRDAKVAYIVVSSHLLISSTSRYIILGEVTHSAIGARMPDTHPDFTTAPVLENKSRCTTMCFLYAAVGPTRVKKLRERALSFCTRVAAPPRKSEDDFPKNRKSARRCQDHAQQAWPLQSQHTETLLDPSSIATRRAVRQK